MTTVVRLGLIARRPKGRRRIRWDEYEPVSVPAEEIVGVIPWDDAPARMREIALEEWQTWGRPWSLVILRSGLVPSPRGRRLYQEWQRIARSRRKGRSPRLWATMEDHLREAGWGTVAEAADSTGYNPDTLRLLARRGRVSALKVRGRWWIHLRSLEVYAAKRPRHGRRGPRRLVVP